MSLKYAELLKQRPDQPCPCPKSFAPRERTAFRLMHNPPTESGDFVPPAMLPGAPTLTARDRCSRLALSFFESVEAARRLFAAMAQRIDAAKRYGDHIGELDLVIADGVMSGPDKNGHINLHQDSAAKFVHRVTNLKKVLSSTSSTPSGDTNAA